MLYQEWDIRNEGSQEYARLCTYIIEHTEDVNCDERPMIILCPGGGYEFTSGREAEMMAMQFLAKGYHAAVLWYSVRPSVYPAAMLEVGKSVATIREHAKEWHVNPDKIVIEGCSAGGHLTASYGVFWSEDFVAEKLNVEKEMLRPNGLILSYPVITSGEFAHRGSFNALLNGIETPELLQKMSLEYQVNENVPRTFIWTTFEDETVPPENSLMFVNALRKQHIPVEFHMFEKGAHGLGLANKLTEDRNGFGIQQECEKWIDLALTWMSNL